MKAIYWLRTDLRIEDNPALSECLKSHEKALFIFAETKSLRKAGPIRREFVRSCFEALKSELNSQGLEVLETELLFSDFIQTLSFEALYYTQECAWDEREEEKRVKDYCQKKNIVVKGFEQNTLIAFTDLPFTLENMPFVFTDFRKKIEGHLTVQPLVRAPFEPKKNKGRERLNHYLWESDAIQDYKETRNGMIQFDDSSKLSPWLNQGVISARTVFHELKKYESEVCENQSTYWLFFELLWRDYFKFFSLKFGPKIFLTQGLGKGASSNLNDLKSFHSWCEGKTRDAFINANMNELNQTGWMSNRGRQNVASYLIHDLGINWTWGASYFEEKLFDYDPDLNWGNWLYLSGRGSDPRARKFNTAKQAETYDPNGEYRQLWRSS